MRALRFPGQSVKSWKRGHATRSTRKNIRKKPYGFRERFGAAIRIGDEEGGTAKFVREVRSDQSFGNIVQTRKRNVPRAIAQRSERAFHRGVAKHSFQSFANGRQDHAGTSGFHARGLRAFADLSENRRGGIAGHDGIDTTRPPAASTSSRPTI